MLELAHHGFVLRDYREHIVNTLRHCDLAGLAHPPFLQGRSLLPLARRETDEIRSEIFAEATFDAADDGLSKVSCCLGWADQRIPFEQLHDLAFDANEASNLADDPRYAELRDDPRGPGGALDARHRRPAPARPVGPPRGAELNLPDQRSPSDPTVIAE